MNNEIHQAEAVFFDWDGTLVDSFLFLHKAHNHVRKTLGIEPFSVEVFKTYFGQPREKLYTQLYGDDREAAKKHFEEFVIANHANELKTLDGAEDVLQWFYDAGIPCGVVTNKKGDLVRAEIATLGWNHFFTGVVGAGEAEKDKPSSAPLLLAIERAGLSEVDKARIWYVGDTDNDIKCSISAGCPNVLIGDEEEHLNICNEYTVTLNFANQQSFLDLLLQSVANSLKAKTIG